MTGLEQQVQALEEEVALLNSQMLNLTQSQQKLINQNRELKLIIQREKPQPSNKAWFLLGE